MWRFDTTYELLDGSSWWLDCAEDARQQHIADSIKERRSRGYLSQPTAWLFRTKGRFFLMIDTMGRKRRVIPVHLPDPDRYHNGKPVQRAK
jgi:predicted RNA polymerase sigma factor